MVTVMEIHGFNEKSWLSVPLRSDVSHKDWIHKVLKFSSNKEGNEAPVYCYT